MALPVYATFLANLKGDVGEQGPEGRPGTFDSADAVSVAPTEPARAIISGEFGEHVTFEIPKGEPGVNAVPADEAIGTYVATPGSNSRTAVAAAVDADGAVAMADTGSALSQAAQGLFPVFRVWDEVEDEYPPRVPGARNIFVGAVDPGLLMDPESDVWEPGDATSNAAVAAAMRETSSDLFSAAQFAATSNRISLKLNPVAGSTLERVVVGSSPNRLFGWKLPDGVSSVIFAAEPVPLQWNTVRIRVRWVHTVSEGSGNVRWFCDISPYQLGAVPGGGAQQTTSQGVAPAGQPHEAVFSGLNPVTPGGGLTVAVGRLGGSGADSFTGDIVILDAWMERTT